MPEDRKNNHFWAEIFIVLLLSCVASLCMLIMDSHDILLKYTRSLEIYQVVEWVFFTPLVFSIGISWILYRRLTDLSLEKRLRKKAENGLKQNVEIAEPKRAEAALAESENRFRELFSNMFSGVAIYEADKDGNDFILKDINLAGEGIDGIRKKDMIGKSVRQQVAGIQNSGLYEMLQRVWNTGDPEYYPIPFHNDSKALSWRTYHVYKLPCGEIVTVYEDVTTQKLAQSALKESEKRFRNLVENALVGICILLAGRVVYMNPEQHRIFGGHCEGFDLKDIKIYSEDRTRFDEFYERVAGGGLTSAVDLEFRFSPPKNEKYPWELSWVHCRASSINFNGENAVLINMVDITRAKELEVLVNIKEKMANLGNVAAGIAHEIRNPLSGINLFLNGIEENFDNPDAADDIRQLISETQKASDKISTVIKRVIDFSRPGQLQLRLKDINVPIREAVELSKTTLRKQGILIKTNLNDNLPSIFIDQQPIEQVVLNLLNNAAEAMRELDGAKLIRIHTTEENGHVIITVSDSGNGIPEEIQSRIFDPFFTTRQNGSGIGLSLCHRIISDHGGSIKVISSERDGTEFIIKLPIEKRKNPR